MKIYRGKITRRDPGGRHPIVSRRIIIVDSETGQEKPLPTPAPLYHKNPSKDGFNWGYGGAGPSTAALAILADCCGRIRADKFYNVFKWDFLVHQAQEQEWEITEERINQWIKKLETKERELERKLEEVD